MKLAASFLVDLVSSLKDEKGMLMMDLATRLD